MHCASSPPLAPTTPAPITALAGSLRSACLEQAALLARQFEALVGFHDPAAMRSIEVAVRQAHDRLQAAPSRQG
ncbi:MAG: hypothetical protein H0W40_07990 [Methylibium sp.]|uniref:hypothetical protein n=1 Tax=Methylibium sp. TaxID=2067992 RepID=UPI001847E23A|nr:hypothetical protein [Methylibium sp.]MBA3597303.1 hypothetical protein [Methylibium sp.]